MSCGHDFGPRPPAWGGDVGPRDYGEVERDLAELRRLGIEIARFWVLAGGVNYPVGADPDTIADLVATDDGPVSATVRAALGRRGAALTRRLPAGERYRELRVRDEAALPELPDRFLRDFDSLLTACDGAGVQLLPSLLSFELFQPAIALGRGVVKRGRRSFVFGNPGGPARLEELLDATLHPLLEVSGSRRSAVFAWEVINEPEWAVEGGPLQVDPNAYGWVPTTHWVQPTQMSALVRRGVERIAAAGFLATVGFEDADPSWLDDDCRELLRRLAADGRYLHQRHHYPTLLSDHRLPAHDELELGPCMLGELPTAPGGAVDNIRWRDPELRASETDPNRYLEARLEHIRRRGYPIALLWSAHSDDGRRRWTEAQKAQVARFCSG